MNTNYNLFADAQLDLFEMPSMVALSNHAAARTLYGSLCEQIAAEALGLRRLKISGSFDACYDAQDKDGGLYEIKSVKRNGAVPVWIWRMKKDLKAAEFGFTIRYVFVNHNCSGMRSSEELWQGLASSVKEIFVVPVATIAEIHATSPFGGMNLGTGGSGYSRVGYRDGYRRVSMKTVKARCATYRETEFTVSSHRFAVKIFFA